MHQVGENEYVEIGSGVPIESENLVEFHLLYSGPLHSRGDRKEKHAIRKVFHAQLKHLWLHNPNLRRLAEHEGRMKYSLETARITNPPQLSTEDAIPKGVAAMGENWSRNGFHFTPLVTKRAVLRCSLDILFLRVEEKNYVLQAGDIDGRIKTLFDSLRMVRDGNEVPANLVIEPDEDPFCCLLEDDELISEVKVTTDRLLGLPNKPLEKSDVYLQITVKLNPTTIGWDTWIV